jgi:MFS family permease
MQDQTASYRVGTLTYTRQALAVLFFWLLWGDLCFTLMETVVPSILPLKLESLGASNVSVGLILATIPNAVMSVCNPIISFKSDRFRSRFGRRIPFIVVGTPLIVLSILGITFAVNIGNWLHRHTGALLAHSNPATVSLLIIGLMMGLFGLFNMLGTSAYWYLFNDVVPPTLLARFMSWFRLVSLASVSLYNFFIFKYAGAHANTIMVSIAVLYLVGFGLMCLNVREGEYPPPPGYSQNRRGFLAAVKTFAVECHAFRHYWYVFLIGIGAGGTLAAANFALYFNQAIGLSLEQIGNLNGTLNVATSLLILISGYLADRYHPIRVVAGGLIFQVLLATPVTMIWLFWHPSSHMTFVVSMVISVLLTAPAAALIGVLDPPLLMRVFPRTSYGQFCSANSIWRSWSVIVGGALVGWFLDILTHHLGRDTAFRLLPLWFLGSYLLMLYATLVLYRSWKRHGGDDAYVAPMLEIASEPVLPVAAEALA